MDIASRAVAWVLAVFGPFGTLGLFVLAASESVFNPVPPDLLLVPLVLDAPERWPLLAAVATAGSVAGAALGWALGRWGARFVRPRVGAGRIARAEAIYARFGMAAILVAAFTPVPYKVFTITSGLLHYPFRPFMAASLVGRGARFAAVAALAAWQGPAAVALVDRAGLLGVAAMVLAGGIAWSIHRRWRARRAADAAASTRASGPGGPPRPPINR